MGFAVDAYEYVGDAGTGGSLLGVGDTGRLSSMVVVYAARLC
jgi:hypothetical protein